MTSWGSPISTHLATYKNKNARISCHWCVGSKMKFRSSVRGDLHLCPQKRGKERLTPGKPNSYSPKPTREIKGTTESGLKNLKTGNLISTTLNFSKESNHKTKKIYLISDFGTETEIWQYKAEDLHTERILRLIHDIWQKCFKLSINCFQSNSTILGCKLTL